MAWTQPRNAEGELTGFVEIIARVKAPMPLEEWKELFCCRVATGIEDARDLGEDAEALRAEERMVLEEGVRARMLEDGRWIRETRAEEKRRTFEAGLHEMRERGDEMERWRAQRRLRQEGAAEAEPDWAAPERVAASAAVAARAMLAVRAAWQRNNSGTC